MTMTDASLLEASGQTEGLVSVRVGGQVFGIAVLRVQDVIAQTSINRVPLGPHEVAGSLNLRGRIVTAIDMRRRLGMAPRAAAEGFMSVIVERRGELYALLVDDVGDVLWLPSSKHEDTPVTLAVEWRALCSGLYRLEGELLLVLSIDEVLMLSRPSAGPLGRDPGGVGAAPGIDGSGVDMSTRQ